AKVIGTYEGTNENPIDEISRTVHWEHQTDGRERTSQMMPNTPVRFVASADGYEETSQTLSLPEGEERQIAFQLKKRLGDTRSKSTDSAARAAAPAEAAKAVSESLAYTGTIIDGKTKKPLVDADVRVRLRNHTGPDSRVLGETELKTDANGKYTFV